MIPVIRWLFSGLLWCAALSILWVLLLAVVDPPVTSTMIHQRLEQGSIHRSWRDLDEMARSLPNAVIAAEDQKFMYHFGFDIEAIEKAWGHNGSGRGRKRVKGASTISQQVAKNVFLWQGRTYLRKGLEVWFTLLIETCWSKERIIEVYLNIAELGTGVFGAEAAGMHCFDKSAARLSGSESALLAAVLPAPRRYRCDHPSVFVRSRQQWIYRQMGNLGDQLDPEVRAKAIGASERQVQQLRTRRKKRSS